MRAYLKLKSKEKISIKPAIFSIVMIHSTVESKEVSFEFYETIANAGIDRDGYLNIDAELVGLIEDDDLWVKEDFSSKDITSKLLSSGKIQKIVRVLRTSPTRKVY